jgi:uncharacterized Rossmann fold enzyme
LIRRKINFYDEFKGWYNTIIKDFNFDAQKDSFARKYLSNMIMRKKNWNLETILSSFQDDLLKKELIMIYGCGPSLEITLDFLLRNEVELNNKRIFNIAADGASRLLKERNIKIEATFSDLDGITADEFFYPNYIVVHAHGDNIEKLKIFEKEILEFEKIIFTCQVEPNEYILNPGGFTDGDRILFFLRPLLLPSHRIFLIGMDFINKVGKYSKVEFQKNHKASKNKQKKLRYAAKLIDWLNKYIKNEIYYVNSQKTSQRYKNLDLIQFIKEFE